MKSDSDKRVQQTMVAKRKTGYDDDETEITRKKLRGLSMVEMK